MTDPKPAPEPGTPAGLELQVAITKTIADLQAIAPMVKNLADTHQRGLGFLSFDARQVQNAMVRDERRLRRKAQVLGQPTGHGATAAPGNIAGINADVEIWAVTRHQIRRLNKWLIVRGHQAVEAAGDADTLQLLQLLDAQILTITDDPALRSVHDDLVNVLAQSQNLIDGNDRVQLDVPCPHCGRTTLLVTLKDGVVTCGRDPRTGRHHDCTCPSSVCECKTRPIAYRHTWHRERASKPDGWITLANQIRTHRNATKKEH